MKAILRSVVGIDVELSGYVSDNPENDAVWVRMMVGAVGAEGEESFDLLICTGSWLRDAAASEGPQIGRHHLVVEPLNLEVALAFLADAVAGVQGDDWNEIGDKLSRIGKWEFEDYKPARES
ncbi:Imm8 family immunity protein [Microbacterium sp.]|uniref:Imm8 family immunity protein n=1 Tax=Microbacterium sp. TaxID=51671 RepID=UPI001AC785A2|nr:Imm8 family immunity protein [Microbacterium sp.]MBN9154812.1 immunity 8 family protein [Microbacterium sp.]